MDDLRELEQIDILSLSDSGVVITNAGDKGKPEEIVDGKQPGGDVRLPNGKPLPRKIVLMRIGKNQFVKDGKKGEFDVSDEDADGIIASNKERGRDLVCDYEHQTLSGDRAPAAAWISDLKKEGGNLVAIISSWTPTAQQDLSSGSYRYVSPVIKFADGKAKWIHSVALTNHPSFNNAFDLAASDLATKAETFNRHVSATEGIMEAFNEVAGELVAAMNKTGEFAKGNPEFESKFSALRDKLANGYASFADTEANAKIATTQAPSSIPNAGTVAPSISPSQAAQDKIAGILSTLSPDAAKAKLQDELNKSGDDPIYREQLKAAIQLISTNNNPEAPMTQAAPTQVAQAPVAPQAQAQPAATSAIAPAPVATFSDTTREIKTLTGMLKLSDTSSFSDISQRVSQLVSFIGVAGEYFKGHGVKSFADLDRQFEAKIAETVTAKDGEIKVLNDKLALADCEAVIGDYMRQGKIVESTKEIEIAAFKAMGKENYKKYMESRQPMVSFSDASQIAKMAQPQMGSAQPKPANADKMAEIFGVDSNYDGKVPPYETTLPF